MNSKTRRLWRASHLALALILFSVFPLTPPALEASEPGENLMPVVLADAGLSPAVQTWTLVNGKQVEGALVAYSMQSRLITLKLRDDRTAILTPRDLTTLSKLKWLTSPIVVKAIQSYRWPDGWRWTLAKALAAPTTGLSLGAFLVFWLSASLVMGEKRFGQAAASFLRCLLYVALIGCVTAFMIHATHVALGNSPLSPVVRGAALCFGLVAALIMVSCRVGGDYAQTAAMGLGTVLTGLVLGCLLATGGFFLLPHMFEQPGLDQWLTDRLLSPLGLV